jgi:hypothetical protein
MLAQYVMQGIGNQGVIVDDDEGGILFSHLRVFPRQLLIYF